MAVSFHDDVALCRSRAKKMRCRHFRRAIPLPECLGQVLSPSKGRITAHSHRPRRDTAFLEATVQHGE